MNSKKLQHFIFTSLLILSISSSLYLNLQVDQDGSSLARITESASESSETLMADIDAFQNFIKNISKQIVFN